jgi:hypothetical protein
LPEKNNTANVITGMKKIVIAKAIILSAGINGTSIKKGNSDECIPIVNKEEYIFSITDKKITICEITPLKLFFF